MNNYAVMELMPGNKFKVVYKNKTKEEAEKLSQELNNNALNMSTFQVVEETGDMTDLEGLVELSNYLNRNV